LPVYSAQSPQNLALSALFSFIPLLGQSDQTGEVPRYLLPPSFVPSEPQPHGDRKLQRDRNRATSLVNRGENAFFQSQQTATDRNRSQQAQHFFVHPGKSNGKGISREFREWARIETWVGGGRVCADFLLREKFQRKRETPPQRCCSFASICEIHGERFFCENKHSSAGLTQFLIFKDRDQPPLRVRAGE
jgi:hypothetical protein